MGKGSSSGSTQQHAEIPAELKELYNKTGDNIRDIQRTNPVLDYIGSRPARIAPMSRTQNRSLDLMNYNLDDAMRPLGDSDIVRAGTEYFDKSIAPGITNEATLSGLGRSTALSNARAAAHAQTALPLFQAEQARRDAMIGKGFEAGDIERGVEQQGYNADTADFLRRQGLAEQALFGPMGQLPSTFGQSATTKNSGASGMFK
jgi:hypothetical protein